MTPHTGHGRTWPVVLAIALAALGVWLFVAKASSRMPDFEVYRRAGERAAAAEPLYRASDADYQFKYFPAFAVLAIPLGLMPVGVAKVIWFAMSAAALVALLPLTAALLPHRRKPVWLLIAALLIGLGKYYAEDLVLGQINTIVALVATCAILALHAGREAAGGFLVALAIVLKPYALILAPWLVARRRGRSIATLGLGLAIAAVLPFAIYGSGAVALLGEWWRTVTTTTEGTLLHSDNVSLASLWAKRLGIVPAAGVLAAVSSIALLVGAAVVFLRRRGITKPEGLEAGILLAITPLLSPQGWDYVVILATMAMAYVVNDLDRLPRALQVLTVVSIAAIGLSLYDLLGRTFLYALLDLSIITIGVVILISALASLRMRKLA